MTNFFPLVGDMKFDRIECTYDGGGNLVDVVYKEGGAGGNIVTHLTITYDGGGNVLTVDKTVL